VTTDRPILTIDFDGVVCAPPLSRNLGIHRDFLDDNAPPLGARTWPRWLGDPLDHLRFDWRRPLPEVRDALKRLAANRTLVVLTGRRSSPLPWMRRHGMADYFDRIVINQGPRKSPHYKLEQVLELGAIEHVDDDARTAQLLAQHSEVRVFLRDWPRNRDLEFHPAVQRVNDLLALAELIETDQQIDD
jgi:hypothetical protein